MANARNKADDTADLGSVDLPARDRVAVIDDKLADGIERAGDGAQAAVTALEERSRTAIEVARRKANEARATLERLEREASGQFEQTSDQVSALIREKPMQAAGVAFAAGMLATLLLRRR